MAFIGRGGDNSWPYILDVVHQLVEQNPLTPGRIYTSAEGEDAVGVTAALHAGTFYYIQQGMSDLHDPLSMSSYCPGVASEVTFSRGSEYFSSRLVPQLLPDETTRSASSRESRSRSEHVSRFLALEDTSAPNPEEPLFKDTYRSRYWLSLDECSIRRVCGRPHSTSKSP